MLHTLISFFWLSLFVFLSQVSPLFVRSFVRSCVLSFVIEPPSVAVLCSLKQYQSVVRTDDALDSRSRMNYGMKK